LKFSARCQRQKTTRSFSRIEWRRGTPCFSPSRRDVRSGSPHLKVSNNPHVLVPSQSQRRKDTTEESEYAGSPRRRCLPPVTFVPRWVDSKKPWKSPDAGFVAACHTNSHSIPRSLPRAWLTLDPHSRIAISGRHRHERAWCGADPSGACRRGSFSRSPGFVSLQVQIRDPQERRRADS
jgi:hypothetical protein